MFNDTTRCYPRTLHNAFPDDRCEYAMCCETRTGVKFALPMPEKKERTMTGVIGFLRWAAKQLLS